MTTRITEIADSFYRLSTFVPDIAPPAGFTFNQFLIMADEPLLFHTGHRRMFPQVRDAVARLMPPERLRWISFGHFEADECGAMNEWLAAAPHAQVVHGHTACSVSLNDVADRPPRELRHGETIDLGGKRVRYLDTPHTPHAWDSAMLYEESTGTLLCGDLFTQFGGQTPITDGDIVGAAMQAEDLLPYSTLAPTTGATIRKLADLEPRTLGLMHGSSFAGDCAGALRDLAGAYDERVSAAMAAV